MTPIPRRYWYQQVRLLPDACMTRTIRRPSRWWRHEHPMTRRHLNRKFRNAEKHHIRARGEPLRKTKTRGWKTW